MYITRGAALLNQVYVPGISGCVYVSYEWEPLNGGPFDNKKWQICNLVLDAANTYVREHCSWFLFRRPPLRVAERS